VEWAGPRHRDSAPALPSRSHNRRTTGTLKPRLNWHLRGDETGLQCVRIGSARNIAKTSPDVFSGGARRKVVTPMVALDLSSYLVNVKAIQYTSGNVDDFMDTLDAAFPPAESTINAGVISSVIGTFNPTDWFVRDYTFGTFLVTDSRFQEFLAPQSGTSMIALGIATVPTLLGNSQTTVQVTITPTFADTDYQASAVLTGAVSLLASLSVLSTTVFSASRVDVVVRNTGLLSLSGASCLVAAIHN